MDTNKMHTIIIPFTIRGSAWHPDKEKITQFSHVQLHTWPFPDHTYLARWTKGKKEENNNNNSNKNKLRLLIP